MRGRYDNRDRRKAEPPPVAGRVPPHDLHAEASVLSALLLTKDALDQVSDVLKEEHFYSDPNRRVFQAILALSAANDPIDIVSVAAWLRDRERLAFVGGSSYLAVLSDATPAIGHVAKHAAIVREHWRIRQLIANCQRIAAEGYGDVGDPQEFIEAAKQTVDELLTENKAGRPVRFADALRPAMERVSKAAHNGQRLLGISTGYPQMDRKTAGLQDGHLTIIAARAGHGKTAFATGLAVNVAESREVEVDEAGYRIKATAHGYGVCIFSGEMSREELALRMTCTDARVDGSKLARGETQRDEWDRLMKSAEVLSRMPIWIDDTPALTAQSMLAKLRTLQTEYNVVSDDPRKARRIGLAITDHIGIMGRDRNIPKHQGIGDIAEALKNGAKDLGIQIVALCQLNRMIEQRPAKQQRPLLSDLKDSGGIEESADNVIFIHRPEKFNPNDESLKGIAEIIIAKQRAGAPSKVLMRFSGFCTRFDEMDPRDVPESFHDE